MAQAFKPSDYEKKWQDFWLDNKTFSVTEDADKPKYYVLDMFPYPSGSGLHVGHPEGYTATDIISRYKRMKGFNVLHPMGWDAFGLPAEQYALQTGTHPAVTTKKNIENFKRQIISLGFSYDWDREIATCDADYYKWTQWIFSQLYKKGLAYVDEVPVNWCPALGTVLANEEVIDGKSERGGHPVERKPMRQWVLRITEYAEKLLAGLEDLDWPEGVKKMQQEWIGRSEGSTVDFKIQGQEELSFQVYTTRPDTLFGATYCVLAPEHKLVEKIASSKQKEEVSKYCEAALNRAERARLEDAATKTGVFTGAFAVNPATSQPVPIYVGDYVLGSYGTGAIMAVPGHDQRDWDFAKAYDLEIKEVVSGGDISKEAWAGDGVLVNSGFLDGLGVSDAKAKMIDWLEEKKLGTRTVNYKLRDWLFSRQRYWGEPFPILIGKDGPKLIDESLLPVKLPEIEAYQPTEDGKPPLARATDWLEVTDPETGETYLRETNTMPQWAGSCWYYLRYIDPKNSEAAWDKNKESYWMPVDLYVGGAEHAVLHLLYSRFWHHVLFDLGLVSTPEPYQKLVNQGMILGEDNQKMSKSRGNVINPDTIVDKYGADTLRLYEMFMGPLEQTKPWNSNSVGGVHRFLQRVWNIILDKEGSLQSKIDTSITARGSEVSELDRSLSKLVKKVGEDIEQFKFHTAISAMMSFSSELADTALIPGYIARQFILLLAPFAPHIAEELWEKLGGDDTLAFEPWPEFDPELIVDNEVEIVVQVNGKKRDSFKMAIDADKDSVLSQAKSLEKVSGHTQGKTIVKEIFVPNKLVNLVVK